MKLIFIFLKYNINSKTNAIVYENNFNDFILEQRKINDSKLNELLLEQSFTNKTLPELLSKLNDFLQHINHLIIIDYQQIS
jgi:hypothetical protein